MPTPPSNGPLTLEALLRHFDDMIQQQQQQTMAHFDRSAQSLAKSIEQLEERFDQFGERLEDTYVRRDLWLVELGGVREKLTERGKLLEDLRASHARLLRDFLDFRNTIGQTMDRAVLDATVGVASNRQETDGRAMQWLISGLYVAAGAVLGFLLRK